MNEKQKLINLIGQQKYDELNSKISPTYNKDIQLDFSDYLLQKSEQEILDFYSDLVNSNYQWTIPKIVGNVIILTSHIHDLLIKLVERRETDQKIIKSVSAFDLHNTIIFCTARYDIIEECFIQMMGLKNFRNTIAHDFNAIMETGFHQAIHPISDGDLIILTLIEMLREKVYI